MDSESNFNFRYQRLADPTKVKISISANQNDDNSLPFTVKMGANLSVKFVQIFKKQPLAVIMKAPQIKFGDDYRIRLEAEIQFAITGDDASQSIEQRGKIISHLENNGFTERLTG